MGAVKNHFHDEIEANNVIEEFNLVVEFVYPPIPDRNFDYRVYVNGQEENGNYGYGATRAAAVENWFYEQEQICQ